MNIKRIKLFSHRLFPFFITLILVFAGWLSLHSQIGVLWQEQPRFILTKTQKTALAQIQRPLEIEAFISGNPRLRREIQTIISNLKKEIPNLSLRITDPNSAPHKVNQYNITRSGQLLLRDGEQYQRIEHASAPLIVQAILEQQGMPERVIIHLQGHDERDFLADTGGSWQSLYQAMQNKHLSLASLNLAQHHIPKNTDLLIIADPDPEKLENDWANIATYLENGGNLLFTTDTHRDHLPPSLATLTGLQLEQGTIIDLTSKTAGFVDPRILITRASIKADISKDLTALPILLGAAAIREDKNNQKWQRQAILQSSAQSWAEQSPISGTIRADENEARGVLTTAWLLTRPYQDRQQSILIIGDSDLWSGQALGLGGNRDFARNAFALLANITSETALSAPLRQDQYLNISETALYQLGILLLFALPLAVLSYGYWQRKQFRRRYHPSIQEI